jgi:hypothetical protein
VSAPPLLNAAGRRRSPVTLPGYLAGRPPQQGAALPARPAHGRGDRRGHAPGRRRRPRRPHAGADRVALALRATDHGGAHPQRARPRAPRRVGARPPRQGRPPPRGRHGPLGLGPPPALARAPDRDAGRAAAVRARRGAGRATQPAPNSGASPAKAGVRRRFAPHQLRHAHAVELAHEGVPLNVIQRQLGHTNLGVTSIYLQGIDNAEIIATVHARKAPMVPASTGLRI